MQGRSYQFANYVFLQCQMSIVPWGGSNLRPSCVRSSSEGILLDCYTQAYYTRNSNNNKYVDIFWYFPIYFPTLFNQILIRYLLKGASLQSFGRDRFLRGYWWWQKFASQSEIYWHVYNEQKTKQNKSITFFFLFLQLAYSRLKFQNVLIQKRMSRGGYLHPHANLTFAHNSL